MRPDEHHPHREPACTPVPRYRPELPLPPYTYVPGGSVPHPISDPAGHSYGSRPPTPADAAARRSALLWGLDLFNHGFYWEAHEAWEALWVALGRTGPEADAIKGLIHLAASGVKVREGVAAGVASHLNRAHELFALLPDRTPAGIAGDSLAAASAALRAAAVQVRVAALGPLTEPLRYDET